MSEPGQIAFEAYRDAIGGVRPWRDVRDPERMVWETVESAVVAAAAGGDPDE